MTCKLLRQSRGTGSVDHLLQHGASAGKGEEQLKASRRGGGEGRVLDLLPRPLPSSRLLCTFSERDLASARAASRTR